MRALPRPTSATGASTTAPPPNASRGPLMRTRSPPSSACAHARAGQGGGSVPTGARREIVLSLARLSRIRALDALDDTVIAEAGCVLAQVQQAALDAGRCFPVSLGR